MSGHFYIENYEYEYVFEQRQKEIEKTGVYTGSYPDVIFHLEELDEYTKEFLDDIDGLMSCFLMSDALNVYIGLNEGKTGYVDAIDFWIPIRKLACMTIPDLGNYIFGIWNAYISLKPEKNDVD